MAFGTNKIKTIYQAIVRRLYEKEYGGKIILNINRDLLNKTQKTVLLCYMVKEFETNFTTTITHANMYHSLQMVKVLANHGFAIDVCHAKSVVDLKRLKREYDYIIGFGPLYEAIINDGIKGRRILLLTENDPKTVQEKYAERIAYFKQRHGSKPLKYNTPRTAFYSENQVNKSEVCIAMNSDYNLSRIQRLMPTYKVKVNTLCNPNYEFEFKNLDTAKKHFVWFGSAGAIHKGLDILVDAFAELPDLHLSIYGLTDSEVPLIEPLLTPNVQIKGRIDVRSDEFITEVVNKHAFVISASCSEGMNTGVATCMMHGLIPVVTKETGFDNPGMMIEFEGYKVCILKDVILSASKMENECLEKLSKANFDYSNANFTLDNFTKEFDEILSNIENKYPL